MEVHGGEGVLRFFQYVADRTDIALGLFNSGSSGYALTPGRSRADRQRDPRGVRDEGRDDGTLAAARPRTRSLPELVIWECDTIVYKAGWLQQGIVGPAQLGTAGYFYETPEKRMLTNYWTMVWEGRLAEAIEYALGDGPRPDQRGGRRLVHALPGTARLLHALG